MSLTEHLELICVWKAGETIPFITFVVTNIEQSDNGNLILKYEDTHITLSSDEWDYFYSTEINSKEDYYEQLSNLTKMENKNNER